MKRTVLLMFCAAVMCAAVNAQEEFTIVTLNVDGLPANLIVDINPDGPGETWTPKIGEYFASKAYDIIAVQENFNFHEELCSGLGDGYSHDSWPGAMTVDKFGTVDELRMPVDGLNCFWSNDITGGRTDSVKWERSCGFLDHAADSLATKGFRRYELTLKGGAQIVVYNLHADATDDPEELTGKDIGDRNARYFEMVQLRQHILDNLDTRPVIVLGDFNCYYNRDTLKAQLIDYISNTGRATAGDAMITLHKGGVYPEVRDTVGLPIRDGIYIWSEDEELDKIIYINPVGGAELTPLEFTVDKTGYVRDDGTTPLGDHWPAVAKFKITTAASTGVNTAGRSVVSGEGLWYTIDGRTLSRRPSKGVFIHQGKAFINR